MLFCILLVNFQNFVVFRLIPSFGEYDAKRILSDHDYCYDSLTRALTRSITHSRMHARTHARTYSPTSSLTRSPVIYLFMYVCIYYYLFI